MRPTEDASRFFVVVVEHLGWCPPGLGALCKLCTLHISIVHIVQTGPQGHFKVGPQRGRGSSLTQHIPLHMSSFDVTYTLVLQILFRHCLPPLVFPGSPYHPFCPPPPPPHFIQNDLQLRNTISQTLLRGKLSQEVLVIQHLRHCSEKNLLDRERLRKESKIFIYLFFAKKKQKSSEDGRN